ncbi:MAG: hypothetical protein M1530_01845 [Candidatus Marsarchaeota archaeon]|nr:hypothetical protein [Candidatus Marsarchaeota archaeon]
MKHRKFPTQELQLRRLENQKATAARLAKIPAGGLMPDEKAFVKAAITALSLEPADGRENKTKALMQLGEISRDNPYLLFTFKPSAGQEMELCLFGSCLAELALNPERVGSVRASAKFDEKSVFLELKMDIKDVMAHTADGFDEKGGFRATLWIYGHGRPELKLAEIFSDSSYINSPSR